MVEERLRDAEARRERLRVAREADLGEEPDGFAQEVPFPLLPLEPLAGPWGGAIRGGVRVGRNGGLLSLRTVDAPGPLVITL